MPSADQIFTRTTGSRRTSRTAPATARRASASPVSSPSVRRRCTKRAENEVRSRACAIAWSVASRRSTRVPVTPMRASTTRPRSANVSTARATGPSRFTARWYEARRRAAGWNPGGGRRSRPPPRVPSYISICLVHGDAAAALQDRAALREGRRRVQRVRRQHRVAGVRRAGRVAVADRAVARDGLGRRAEGVAPVLDRGAEVLVPVLPGLHDASLLRLGLRHAAARVEEHEVRHGFLLPDPGGPCPSDAPTTNGRAGFRQAARAIPDRRTASRRGGSAR